MTATANRWTERSLRGSAASRPLVALPYQPFSQPGGAFPRGRAPG